jgi:hypothetical protein
VDTSGGFLNWAFYGYSEEKVGGGIGLFGGLGGSVSINPSPPVSSCPGESGYGFAGFVTPFFGLEAGGDGYLQLSGGVRPYGGVYGGYAWRQRSFAITPGEVIDTARRWWDDTWRTVRQNIDDDRNGRWVW